MSRAAVRSCKVMSVEMQQIVSIPYSYNRFNETYNIEISPEALETLKTLVVEGAKYLFPDTLITFAFEEIQLLK